MSEKKKDNPNLVIDPFRFSTLEVSELQNSDEPIPDDEWNVEDSDEQLSKLADVIHDTTLKQVDEERLICPQEDIEKQISEDRALEEYEKNTQSLAEQPLKILDQMELQSYLETLFFMSDKPLSIEKIKSILGEFSSRELISEAIQQIQSRYQHAFHGFELVEIAEGYQFRTKPGRAHLAAKLAKTQTQRLSRGAMETLAIVAYKQPVLKEEIDKIRGVDSSYFIRNLLDKKLVQIAGRSDLPGRPILYTTTQEFLEIFSLKDLKSLPPLKELEKMVPASEMGEEAEEDDEVKAMRKLVHDMKSDKNKIQYDPKEDESFLSQIRDKIKSIPTSTPYLEELKENETQEKQKEPGL